jgi:hypothetical protein
MKKKYTLILVLFLAASCSVRQKDQMTFVDLVKRLTDLEYLAVLPEKGEQCQQWSSFDRKSHYNEDSDLYENWSANADGTGQFIRKEGENIVMAEMKGPGAIVRIWSAMPEGGHVKIFIDGSESPVVDMPFRNYFDNTVAPFNYPELCYVATGGHNCYIPIPYTESCKVVAEPGWGNYYHFNYITFPAGTGIRSFTMELSAEEQSALKGTNDYFASQMGKYPFDLVDSDVIISRSVEILAGSTTMIEELSGPGVIKAVRVKPSFSNRTEEEIALRDLVVQIRWDHSEQPAVWTPLGDFFGTTPGINHYKTLPTGMTGEGFYSFWYMPFAENACIEIQNRGDRNYAFEYEIVHGNTSRPIEKLGRFHAKWHGDVFPVTDDRWPDWTLLKTKGAGRFVGTMLHVVSPSREPCVEPAGPGHAWWGEGDEKFFVDGEKFPGTYGTGTEDYFGYAWGDPGLFQQAFHSQNMTMNNQGHQTMNRWHITDNIPFRSSFDGYIEKYYPNDCGTRYNAVVYWYLSADGTDYHQPVDVTHDVFVVSPGISPSKGKFLKGDELMVELRSKVGSIYYTLDGTIPTKESRRFSKPVVIDKTTVLKAITILDDGHASMVTTGRYELLDFLEPENKLTGLSGGVVYQYYEGEWEKLPDFKMEEQMAGGIAKDFNLSMVGKEDDYGLVYSGFIAIPEDGMYTFYLTSDDGSKLYIGDRVVVDNDYCHGEQEVSEKVALKAGYHKIRVTYFEARLYNVLNLSYSGPGIKKTPVSDHMLFHLE